MDTHTLSAGPQFQLPCIWVKWVKCGQQGSMLLLLGSTFVCRWKILHEFCGYNLVLQWSLHLGKSSPVSEWL